MAIIIRYIEDNKRKLCRVSGRTRKTLFYNTCQLKTGEGNHGKNLNYCRIFNVRDLVLESYDNFEYVGETIERKSRDIVRRFVTSEEKIRFFSYVMREIMRNVVEHSESCQFKLNVSNKYNDILIIDVEDNGIGIRNSLNTNPNYNVKDDKIALDLAIKPGITKAFGKRKRNDVWQNSGFGLYMISSICKEFGCFYIESGGAKLEIEGSSTRISNIYNYNKGTRVIAILDKTKIRDITNVLKTLSQKGNEIAKANPLAKIKTASKATILISE